MRETNSAHSAETKRPPLRVAYLFGAGATHAELANVCAGRMSDATFLEKNSLLFAHVSKRVCRDAINKQALSKTIRGLISKSGLSNLELFIGLLERNQVQTHEEVVRGLKKRLERDIVNRLKPYAGKYYLYKALLEFHTIARAEQLDGVITLNYDRLLDEAFEEMFDEEPDYGLSRQSAASKTRPLLKLHGGFGLMYRNESLPIITPGVNKNYLELPYNFIWGRALEILLECDVLRVIGCSLSQNDLGIIDLLFKAHLKRKKEPLVLQIIDFDPPDNRIKEQLGFFPRIERAGEIEGALIADGTITDYTKGSNPFKIWLKAKIAKLMTKRDINKTTYVKMVLE
jgi:hypothetical protein